jgi:hypothetical protein
MSDHFRFISWTPYKKRYDLVLVACIAIYVAAFMLIGSVIRRGDHSISPEILAIRATATAAILLLHVTLSIGLWRVSIGASCRSSTTADTWV